MTSRQSIERRVAEFEMELRAAQGVVVERQRAVAAEKVDRSPEERYPDSDDPELLSRSPPRVRVANAEAALRIAERDVARIQGEIVRHEATLAAVAEAASSVAVFEKAVSPALELDAALTDTHRAYLRETTERMAQLRVVYGSAMEKWLRIPPAAREGVPMPSLAWLTGTDTNVIDVLPRILRSAS